MNDNLNLQTYNDVLDDQPPSLPDNEEYMKAYRFWLAIANEQSAELP